jgi:DNA-binding CsgD family transcriptional regulator
MSALDAFLHAIAHAPSTAELALRIMDGACEALGVDKSGLYLLEPESGRPSEIHVRHLPESFVIGYEQVGRDEDKVLANVLRTRRATYDEQAFPGEDWRRSLLYRSFAARYKIRHYLCAPITDGGAVLGTLNIGRSSEEGRFDRRVCARAARVGRAIGARLTALHALLASPEGAASLEEPGRLRAVRAQLRVRLAQLEETATPLSADDAAQFWRALALEGARPLDSFDVGARRYLLLDPGAVQAADATGPLTRRELEVLNLLAFGESNKAIAFELGLTPSTVSTHLSAARRKLGVRSRVLLVDKAQRGGGA